MVASVWVAEHLHRPKLHTAGDAPVRNAIPENSAGAIAASPGLLRVHLRARRRDDRIHTVRVHHWIAPGLFIRAVARASILCLKKSGKMSIAPTRVPCQQTRIRL